MNREIEFRAWLKFEKKFKKVKMIDFIEEKIWTGANWYDFDDIELIEYTGLKDKNDVKIFEGDIVKKYYPERGGIKPIIFIMNMVTTLPTREKVYWSPTYYEHEKVAYEVIGNIYENPELLGETE